MTPLAVYRTDRIDALGASFDQIWHTEPPDIGQLFIVISQQWDHDGNRHIYQWETT